jgi:uncharacterized membrane protein (DUF373 family)
MSDTHSDVSKLNEASPPSHQEKRYGSNKYNDPIGSFSSNILERGDSIIYTIVGVCFFLGALFALGYSFWDFSDAMLHINEMAAATKGATPQSIVAGAIIKLVSDLLLVLIIMEVLGTVIHYLKEHATSLRPFLFIGIVSATRGILSIGAKLSVENVEVGEFNRAMIELGVNAAVILALGITLKLLGRFVED